MVALAITAGSREKIVYQVIGSIEYGLNAVALNIFVEAIARCVIRC